MRKIAFVFACLAFMGLGRREPIPIANLYGGPITKASLPSKSVGQARAKGTFNILEVFTWFLLALNPATAFNPTAPAASAARLRMHTYGGFSTQPCCRCARELCMGKGDDDELRDENLSDEERKKLEAFRAQLIGQFSDEDSPAEGGAPAEATPSPSAPAEPQGPLVQRMSSLGKGRLLVANPLKFFNPNRSLFNPLAAQPVRDLGRFNLRGPIPDNYPPDVIANALPVLMLIDYAEGKGARGVMLERRTGALMGDLGMSQFGCVAIAPLWNGGKEGSNSEVYIVHNVDDLEEGSELGEGLYLDGWNSAMPRVANSSLAEGRFKFFLGSTTWEPGQLEEEMRNGAWFVLKADPEVFLKDRILGWVPGRRKPIWRDYMELLKDDEEAMAVFDSIYPQG